MANNVNARKEVSKIQEVFPSAKQAICGDKIKFNTPTINLDQLKVLASFDELESLEIKRSGTGLVVIIK